MFILEDPKHEWGKWDFRLVKGLEIHDEMIVGGVPIYWDRSDRVRFEVGTYTSKSKQALDRAEEKARKSKNSNHGKVYYPIPKTTDGGPLPTLEEWLAERAEKAAMSAGKIVVGEGQFSNQPEPLN